MSESVKTSLNLPRRELDAISSLAARRDISTTHAVRQAMQTELFLQGIVDQDGELFVKLPDGELQKLVLTQMHAVEPVRSG